MLRNRLIVAVVLCFAAAGAVPAAELLFEVKPPDQADFNYPPAPREGARGSFAIAKDGRPRCVIVRPKRPAREEGLAPSATLKAYLDLAVGADFSVRYEGQRVPADMGAIYVGDTAAGRKAALDLPQLRYGDDVLPNVNGYLVKTVDARTLVIRGATGRATMLGVVGFLKRYVGVRRYWPGSPGGLGDVVPQARDLALPQIEWRDWPYFISRIMSGLSRHGPKPDPKFRNRVRFDDFHRMNYTIPSNESYYKWLPAAKYGKTHPEYFPLVNGQRRVPIIPTTGPRKGRDPHGWQPCVSNPDVARIMADALIAYFDKNPDKFAVNLAVNDGYGDCRCDKCRAMDAPGADLINRVGLCDRYAKFSNAVCERVRAKHPGKIIAFIAYGSMRQPPTTVKFHPMLMPVLCCGTNAFEMWDSWMRTGARRMGLYLYHDDVWFFIPKMDVRQSAKRIRYLVASGRARSFYQEFYGLWPLDGMVAYVENELLWDPRLKVDDIVNEYYDKFYGPAAGDMRAFYDALESGYERWLREEGLPHPFGKDMGSLTDRKSVHQFKVLNPAEAKAARLALKRAERAAKPDTLPARRVAVTGALFGFADIGARQYWTMRRIEALQPKSEADAQEIVDLARKATALWRELAVYKRDVMEKPPANIYAGHMRDNFYAAIKVGRIHPEVSRVVSNGLNAASACLRERLGAAKAGDWWRARRADEKDEALQGALAMAEAKARGVKLANMVRDPSFEARGAGVTKGGGGKQPPGHRRFRGLRVWHSRGTPFQVDLVTDRAHTGKYAVKFKDTQRASVSEGIVTTTGGRFHLSLWVCHNDKKGKYTVTVLPRGPKGMLARSETPVPYKPGEWQRIEADFTAPPGRISVSLYVFVQSQEPGAEIWADDFFIGRYPD